MIYRILTILFIFSVFFIFLSGKFDSHRTKEGRILWKLPLVDPGMSKDPLVMKGYEILMETSKTLPQYAKNSLNCTNCHFAGGNTLGGRNGGISLVGVTHHYPRKLSDGSMLTIQERINGCFSRSMNGKKLSDDSHEMKAMVAYLTWISKPSKKYKKAPWLGLPDIKSDHVPNPENGEKLFALHCSGCHGPDGSGRTSEHDLGYPPLWGDKSFNSGAGMNRLPIISSFVYYNMPFQDPFLTVEEALDVASFVIKQARPKLEEK